MGTAIHPWKNPKKFELVRPRTLYDVQTMHHRIYGDANAVYSDDDLVKRVMEEAGLLCKFARKDQLEKIPRGLADTFSWTMALANRTKINMQAAMWHKFPGICTACLRTQNCSCGIEKTKFTREEKIEEARRRRRDRTAEVFLLADHQNFHRILYGEQNARILLIQTIAHIPEEASECSQAFRHWNLSRRRDEAKRNAFQEELADLVSWIFAAATKLKIEFADLHWFVYPYECPLCCKTVCIGHKEI